MLLSLAAVTGICCHAAKPCRGCRHSPPCRRALLRSQAFATMPPSLAVVAGIRCRAAEPCRGHRHSLPLPSLAAVTGICRHAAEPCRGRRHSLPCRRALRQSRAFVTVPPSLARLRAFAAMLPSLAESWAFVTTLLSLARPLPCHVQSPDQRTKQNAVTPLWHPASHQKINK